MKGKRIAVAGKGGTGKSTIAALLIFYLRELNQGPVLAIDADPDANLGTLLGIEPQQTVGDLREEVLAEIKNFPAGMSKANFVEAGLHQIIEEAIGFDLITMGRGEGPGCYCYLNNLIRKFSDDLMPSYSWVVIDNEAGLEHISRRTSADLDGLLVVVNENPNSIRTARRIADIGKTLANEIKEMILIPNMVRTDKLIKDIQLMESLPFNHIIDIPFDGNLQELVFRGESLQEVSSPALRDKIVQIVDILGG